MKWIAAISNLAIFIGGFKEDQGCALPHCPISFFILCSFLLGNPESTTAEMFTLVRDKGRYQTHSFLLCQCRSLYRLRFRSHAVWQWPMTMTSNPSYFVDWTTMESVPGIVLYLFILSSLSPINLRSYHGHRNETHNDDNCWKLYLNKHQPNIDLPQLDHVVYLVSIVTALILDWDSRGGERRGWLDTMDRYTLIMYRHSISNCGFVAFTFDCLAAFYVWFWRASELVSFPI